MKNSYDMEAFERAAEKSLESFRGLDAADTACRARLMDSFPLYTIYIIPEGDKEFRVYFFFQTDAQLKASEADGSRKVLEQTAEEELENAGRGRPPETTVHYEFDSHQNVVRHYEGDYSLRLR